MVRFTLLLYLILNLKEICKLKQTVGVHLNELSSVIVSCVFSVLTLQAFGQFP